MSRHAVTPGDLANARLPTFQRRETRALALVESAAEKGRLGVSYSGGKDSTVLLDLVRRVVPDAPAAFFDSGMELASTYEMVQHYAVQTIHPQRSLPDMLRYGGYWGYATPTDPEAEFDFWAFLVGEPSLRFRAEHGLAVIAMGLRAQESSVRRLNAWQRGELYFSAYDQLWHCCPLARWTAEDVWSYLGSRGLRYNSVYDRMAELGIPRAEWRVSALLGSSGAAQGGRFGHLRRIDPALFHRLAAEFPKIKEYT